MPFLSRNKKYSPSYSATANRLQVASQSQLTQRQQFPIRPQSQSNSQQSQPIHPWSAHTPAFRQSPPSTFPRNSHALSPTATAAGELFLFGGYVYSASSTSNDLYVISTQDFSITPLQSSGDVPSPRYGHRAVFTNTTLLIWGGIQSINDQSAPDNSLYLLNLVSREWTRVEINGPGPSGRYFHSMSLVGSKLFVFGGKTPGKAFNDIWAFDLSCLNSNPVWESYEPTPGNDKPFPRTAHVSVSMGNRIIIFGGRGSGGHSFNDTWSFDILTRKWTELPCTGSIPSSRAGHAAVLVDDVMYVFGGRAQNGTELGDLTALNLSSQRWTAFEDIGPSPSGRCGHAMACDGTRVLTLGGELSPDGRVDGSKLIHVLETELLDYPKHGSNTVKHGKMVTRRAQRLSVGHPTQGQPQQPTFASPGSDFYAEHGTSPFQKATPGELDDFPLLLPDMNCKVTDKPRRVPGEDGDRDDSTEHHGKLVAPDASSEKEVARLEHGRIADLERRLSEMLAAQTERDRYNAQLINQLAQKSALLEQTEAEAADAGLELRELQAKLDELMLSRDELLRTLERAQSALQKATSPAADASERSPCACEQIKEYETELAEVRAELKEKKSELEAVRLQLTNAKDDWAKSSTKAEKWHAQNTAGPANANEDGDTVGIMERMKAMEAQIASLRWSEKSFEMIECRNEG